MRRGLRRAGLMSKSVFYAVLIHVIVGALLLFNLEWPSRVVSSPSAQPAPVQAQVVSEAEINEQIQAIRKKEQAEKRKQQEAQEKLDALLKAQQEEQARLTEIKERRKEEARKAEQLALEKEREEQELAKLRQKEEEQRRKEQAEAERKRKAEEERQRKAEQERQRKAEEARRQKEAEEQRQRELREQIERERLQRRVSSALAQYIPIIKQKVTRNWNRPSGLSGHIEAHVMVRLSQAGEVLSVRIVRSSGNPVFDRSVENAVLKASPLPIPQERGVNEEFRSIKLIFKPEEMVS